MADVADILKNPQLYKSLGQLAYSIGKGGTPYSTSGAKMGQFGAQEAENWAAREAREKAKKEQKKKKKGGMLGDIAGTAAGIGTAAIGVPWAAPLVSEAVRGGTSALSGVDYDMGQGLTNLGVGYATLGASKGLGALGGEVDSVTGQKIVEAKDVGKLESALGNVIGPSTAANITDYADNRAVGTGFPKGSDWANQPRYTTDYRIGQDTRLPLVQRGANKLFGEQGGQRVTDYVNQQYGDYGGLAKHLGETGKRNEVPLSSVMEPYPGLSEEGFRSMQAGQVALENAQALSDYRDRSLGIQESQLGLQRQKYAAEQAKPLTREWATPEGIKYKGEFDRQGNLIRQWPTDYPERELVSASPNTTIFERDPVSGSMKLKEHTPPAPRVGMDNLATGEPFAYSVNPTYNEQGDLIPTTITSEPFGPPRPRPSGSSRPFVQPKENAVQRTGGQLYTVSGGTIGASPDDSTVYTVPQVWKEGMGWVDDVGNAIPTTALAEAKSTPAGDRMDMDLGEFEDNVRAEQNDLLGHWTGVDPNSLQVIKHPPQEVVVGVDRAIAYKTKVYTQKNVVIDLQVVDAVLGEKDENGKPMSEIIFTAPGPSGDSRFVPPIILPPTGLVMGEEDISGSDSKRVGPAPKWER